MFLYRYIAYQQNTKAFDKNFIIELTDDVIDELIETFNSSYYWHYLIRSKWFLEEQDMIVWKYVISSKVFRDCEPYLLVMHIDTNGLQNLDVFPKYFKNTRKAKLTPNLYDLENFEHRNKLGAKLDYSKYPLYRNCLGSPQSQRWLND